MTQRLKERRPDKEIYVPRHKRNINKHDVNDESNTIVVEEKLPLDTAKCSCGEGGNGKVSCGGVILQVQSPNTARRRRRKENERNEVESNKQVDINLRQHKEQTKGNLYGEHCHVIMNDRENYRNVCKYSNKLSYLLLEDSYKTYVKTLKHKYQYQCICTFSTNISRIIVCEALLSLSKMERKSNISIEYFKQSNISHFVNDIIYVANVNALKYLKASTKPEIKLCGQFHLMQNDNASSSNKNKNVTETFPIDGEMLNFSDNVVDAGGGLLIEDPVATSFLNVEAVTKEEYTSTMEPSCVETSSKEDDTTMGDPNGIETMAKEGCMSEKNSIETMTEVEYIAAEEPKCVETMTKSSITKTKKKTKEKQQELVVKREKRKRRKETPPLGKSDKEKTQGEGTLNEITTTKCPSPTNVGEEPISDDWDVNYNEDGECLKKETFEASVLCEEGSIESDDVIDYLHFKSKDIVLDIGEFGHILEIFDFPPSYKSSDLYSLLKAAGIADYALHWVDDAHALAVFASQVAAHNALKVDMPFLQMRQAVNGTKESRIKSKDLKDTMLPYKKRPQTTSMVARNMVTGALGVRTNTTKEQRSKEKEMLRQARDEKRSKEKQRREVWDS